MSISFERFTERARQVIVLAQEEARALKHGYIGTEHLLLGLVREEEGLAARVLDALGVTAQGVRDRAIQIVGVGENEESAPTLAFTPRAQKILELSLREALSLGHNYIGTEHVLLGLVRENEGVASRTLIDFEADSEKIRNGVLELLSGGRAPRKAGSLVYTLKLTKGQPGEGGYTACLQVGKDDYATAHAATRDLALQGIVPYLLSTEGFPTDSLEDPIEGLDLRTRLKTRNGLAA